MLNGWDGGLNLTVAPQFILPNESPDCLDVQFDSRGGFATRRGYRTLATTETWIGPDLTLLGPFDGDFLMSSDGGLLAEFDGSATLTETAHVLTDDVDERPNMAIYGGKAYFANCFAAGVLVQRSWDGASLSTLTNTFNDDYTTPDQGDVPKARHIASHNGYLWVADTTETLVRYPGRVRWSHVGQPEDWAEADYVDIDDTTADDPITALLPWRAGLLVFKRNSIHMIGGWDRDSFFQETIATAGGTTSPQAVCTNSGQVYWVSSEGNVFAYDGRKPVPVGNKIRRIWDNEEIDTTGEPAIAWFEGRLWVSVPQSESLNATFVYDPSVGEKGAWTRFAMEMAQIMAWERNGTDFLLFTLGDHDDPTRLEWLYDFAKPAQAYDLIDETLEPVRGYLRTHWITGGETATKKRWRRPRFTLAADSSCVVTVEVYHDFDEYNLSRTALLTIEDPGGGTSGTWDDPDSEWDSGTTWATPNEIYEFTRSSSLGSATAVQLKMYSTDNTGRWWVDSIAFPFRRRQIR
jgi:hypothetical protein